VRKQKVAFAVVAPRCKSQVSRYVTKTARQLQSMRVLKQSSMIRSAQGSERRRMELIVAGITVEVDPPSGQLFHINPTGKSVIGGPVGAIVA
jgi:S-adenosylmethionine synthetase